MHSAGVVLYVIVALGLSVEVAGAQSRPGIPSETYSAADWPTQVVDRTITLPAGMLEVGGDAFLYLAGANDRGESNDFFEVAPSVSYGVSSYLTIGLAQRTFIYERYDGGNGFGEYVTTVDPQQLTPSLTYKFLGDADLGFRARLPMRLTDPLIVDLELALAGRVLLADRRVAILFDAGVALRAVVADEDSPDGSRDTEPVPQLLLDGWFRVSDTIALGARTGLVGRPFPGDDDIVVPVLAVADINVAGQLDLLIATGFASLKYLDVKQLSLGLRYRP